MGMRVHTAIFLMLAGVVIIDLTFDSLLLKNTDEGLLGIQAYYAHARSSPVVPVITILNAFGVLALVLSLVYRRSRHDLFSLVGMLLMLPYFMFVMEPIEDACITAKGLLLPSAAHWRHNFQLVAAGHIAIFVFILTLALLDIDWSLRAPRRTVPATKATKKMT